LCNWIAGKFINDAAFTIFELILLGADGALLNGFVESAAFDIKWLYAYFVDIWD